MQKNTFAWSTSLLNATRCKDTQIKRWTIITAITWDDLRGNFCSSKVVPSHCFEPQQLTPMSDARRRLRKKQSPGLDSISACGSLRDIFVALGPSSAHCLRATSNFLQREVRHLLPKLPWRRAVASIHPALNYMQPLHCSQYTSNTAFMHPRLHLPAQRSWRVSFSRDLPGVIDAGCRLWVRGCDEDFYEAEVFDMDSESWRLLPLMPHARRGATVVAIIL